MVKCVHILKNKTKYEGRKYNADNTQVNIINQHCNTACSKTLMLKIRQISSNISLQYLSTHTIKTITHTDIHTFIRTQFLTQHISTNVAYVYTM